MGTRLLWMLKKHFRKYITDKFGKIWNIFEKFFGKKTQNFETFSKFWKLYKKSTFWMKNVCLQKFQNHVVSPDFDLESNNSTPTHLRMLVT